MFWELSRKLGWDCGRECFIAEYVHICSIFLLFWASLVAQTVKNLPAMQETQVQSLGQKDPLEKDTATHSSILAGESNGERSLVGYSPWGLKELDTTELLHFLSLSLSLYIYMYIHICTFTFISIYKEFRSKEARFQAGNHQQWPNRIE